MEEENLKNGNHLHDLGKELSFSVLFYWELLSIHSNVDVDVSCILLKTNGLIHEVVYYNNLDVNGCAHNGDVRGEGGGENELIDICTGDLDLEVHAIVFSVNCYSGGTLNCVKNAKLTLRDLDEKTIMGYPLKTDTDNKTGLIFGIMYKSSKDHWVFKKCLTGCEGRNFFEIMDVVNEETKFLFPNRGLEFQISKFDLIKKGIINIGNEPRIYLSMGWRASGENIGIDIDASVVAVNKFNEVEYIVYYDKTESPDGSIHHFGDSTDTNEKTQDEVGTDNELISVKLNQIPVRISYLFFVITVFDLKATFDDVDKTWVRILNNKKEEMFSYEIKGDELKKMEKGSDLKITHKNKRRMNAKVMARIFRNPRVPKKWKFEPMNSSFELSREMNVLELAPILQQQKEYFVQPKLSFFEIEEVCRLKKNFHCLMKEKEEWVKKFHEADFLTGLEILKNKEFQKLKIELSCIEDMTDVTCKTPMHGTPKSLMTYFDMEKSTKRMFRK